MRTYDKKTKTAYISAIAIVKADNSINNDKPNEALSILRREYYESYADGGVEKVIGTSF